MVPGTSRPSLRRLGPVAGAALLALALPVLPAAAQELDYRAELVEIARQIVEATTPLDGGVTKHLDEIGTDTFIGGCARPAAKRCQGESRFETRFPKTLI
jgi:hypothetical protein